MEESRYFFEKSNQAIFMNHVALRKYGGGSTALGIKSFLVTFFQKSNRFPKLHVNRRWPRAAGELAGRVARALAGGGGKITAASIASDSSAMP